MLVNMFRVSFFVVVVVFLYSYLDSILSEGVCFSTVDISLLLLLRHHYGCTLSAIKITSAGRLIDEMNKTYFLAGRTKGTLITIKPARVNRLRRGSAN